MPARLLSSLAVLRSYRAHDYTVADAFASRLATHGDKPFCLYEGSQRS